MSQPTLPQFKPTTKPLIWLNFAPYVWPAVLIASIVAFLITLRTPPGFALILHYGGLLLAVGMVAERLAKRITPEWARGIACVVAIVAACLWGRSDYYISHWEKPTEDKTGQSDYTDYIYRRHYRPYYRVLYVRAKDQGYYRTEGGFSDSGKLHGEWRSYSSDDFKTKYEWYWYDEPVSEGEWHLRNR